MLKPSRISRFIKGDAFLYTFAVLSLVNIAAGLAELDWLGYVTKPSLISCLAIWFYTQTTLIEKYSQAFFVGLCFSILGDTFLMFVKTHGEHFFLLGLSSFLFAHLSYILAFYFYPSFSKGKIWKNHWLLLPFLIFFVTALWVLWNDLGALQIPVVAYSFIIIAMAAFSYNMLGRAPNGFAKLLFSGALLFVFSDFFIALSKFKVNDFHPTISNFIIMTTYLVGQFLLTYGMRRCAASQKPATQ